MTDLNRTYWENMYHMPLDELPWEIREAPSELREYIESNRIEGAEALDAGCGTGNFSVYLAQNGFKVVGVDYSERAIEIALDRAKGLGLPLRYVRADLTELEATLVGKSFDLVLDYKVAHHMDDRRLMSYISQTIRLLKANGRLLLVCYSDKDIDAVGQSSAIGKFGNEMHYRSANAIRELYKGLREVSYKEVMIGKHLNHAGHFFVFEKHKI